MRRQLAIVGWGLFCASSWTWCIGMYLPVLLIRHFGWPGVLAFAVPNVAGCVAFGYVLRRRGRRRIPAEHAGACAAFSLVTVALHLFFATFVVAFLIRPGSFLLSSALLTAVALYAVGLGLSRMPDRAWPTAGVVVYGISLWVLLGLGFEPLGGIRWHGDLDALRLAFLAPTLAFGFLLCPYLDLTFHRALGESPSRHAFAVFGVAFSVMILVTCVYGESATVGLATLVIVHLTAQSAFTVAAHLRELRAVCAMPTLAWAWHADLAVRQEGTIGQTTGGARFGGTRGGLPVAELTASSATTVRSTVRVLLGALPLIGVPLALVPLAGAADLRTAEGIYLRFLVFYGLVFPLYVLWFAGPWAWANRRRRSLLCFTGCVVLSAPFYELGFLHGVTWMPLIPLAAILGGFTARRLALRRRRAAPQPLPAPRTASLVD